MRQASIGRYGRAIRLAPVLLALHTASNAPNYLVVDMMSAQWANETTQNSEPSLSVNAAAGQLVVASAYTSGMQFCEGGTSAPLFVSTDDGTTWNLACMIPTAASGWPSDMTVAISADGKSLYAGALDLHSTTFLQHTHVRMDSRVYGWSSAPAKLDAALKSNPGDFTALTSAVLFSRDRTDQPQVRGTGGDRAMAWVGENRSAPGLIGTTADACNWVVAAIAENPWFAPPTTECLSEERPPESTVPAARVATAGKTTYIAMYRPVLGFYDVVVYRRDNNGDFHALTDGAVLKASPAGAPGACITHDGRPGFRAVTCATYSVTALPSDFGQERQKTTELSIAADPSKPERVYLAWAEQSPTDKKKLALHFSRSDNGGRSWKMLPWFVDHATNPALAVASDGAVGVLYEQLTNQGADSRWDTQLAISTNWLEDTPTIHLLASVVASAPASVAPPYLGDYLQLEARGKNFFGVFPASNDLSTGNFPDLCLPRGCPGQRPYKDGKPVDAAKKEVAVSIDPYFVRVIRP